MLRSAGRPWPADPAMPLRLGRPYGANLLRSVKTSTDSTLISLWNNAACAALFQPAAGILSNPYEIDLRTDFIGVIRPPEPAE